MNAKDLIEKLKTFSADAQVLVQGYEGGYDDIKSVNEAAVARKSPAAITLLRLTWLRKATFSPLGNYIIS